MSAADLRQILATLGDELVADLAAKAADSLVVHLATGETITGDKVFGGQVRFKTSPFVDVTGFGAVGDGIADDTVAIGNAKNSLPAAGGTLFFPRGAYLCDTVFVDGAVLNGVTIRGAGRGNTIIKHKSNGDPCIQFNNATDCQVFDLTIDGALQTSSPKAHGIYAAGDTRLAVDRVEIKTTWLSGVYGPSNIGSSVTRSSIHNCGDNNIPANGATANGVWFQGSTRCSAVDNEIYDITRQNGHGVAMDSSSSAGSTDGTIALNRIKNIGCGALTGGGAIRASSSNANVALRTKRITITANVCDIAADSVIWINADECTVTGNTARDGSGLGIEIQDCKDGVLNTNVIENSAQPAIYAHNGIGGGMYDLVGILNWNISDNIVNGTMNGDGIEIREDFGCVTETRGVIVSNNIVRAARTQGIKIAITHGDHVVEGNIILDCGSGGPNPGILLYGFGAATNANTMVRGNRSGDTRNGSQRTQDVGIQLHGTTDYVTVESNDVRNNITVGCVNTSSGTNNRFRTNPGYNPVGVLGPPTVRATTVELPNPYGVDCTVYTTGGMVSSIAVGAAGATSATGLTSGAIRVPAGHCIAITYSVMPTWKWFGD